MYYPKKRATHPESGLVDKFGAASILGVHPETLLSGLRSGKVKLAPVIEKTPGRRRQYWFRIQDVWAERNRLKAAKGQS